MRYHVKLLDRAMREYAVANTWWRTYRWRQRRPFDTLFAHHSTF